MRKLNYKGQILKVYEHWMTKNMWEYYILDNKKGKDIRFALVLGFEDEMGDISASELKPYMLSKTFDLDILPPPGGEWIE